MAAIAWGAVVIDARDPEAMAAFWGRLLGRPWRPGDGEREGWFQIGPTAAGGPGITIQPNPGAAGGGPLHIDLWVDDIEQAMARVEELGGRRGDHAETLARGRIQTAHDPEGNVFCLLAGPEDRPGSAPTDSAGRTPQEGRPPRRLRRRA